MNKAETINETYKHKATVEKFVFFVAKELINRGMKHDNSKIDSFEAEGFAKYTDKLAGLTYGSEEYKKNTW